MAGEFLILSNDNWTLTLSSYFPYSLLRKLFT